MLAPEQQYLHKEKKSSLKNGKKPTVVEDFTFETKVENFTISKFNSLSTGAKALSPLYAKAYVFAGYNTCKEHIKKNIDFLDKRSK